MGSFLFFSIAFLIFLLIIFLGYWGVKTMITGFMDLQKSKDDHSSNGEKNDKK